jgi:hypothetical protein
MNMVSLGKISVVTPGTPVQVSGVPSLGCARIMFAVDPDNAGRVAVGSAGLSLSAKTACARIFNAPLPGPADGLLVGDGMAADIHHGDQYFIDAATSGDGLLVTYWVA